MTARVIQLKNIDGTFHTFLDEMLLERQTDLAIIIATWKPTVSIGNAERLETDVNVEACRRYDIPIVRRKSGGKAVYRDEHYIIFSIIGKQNHFPEDITEIKRTGAETIAEALNKCGIPAQAHEPSDVIIQDPVRSIANCGQIIHPATQMVVLHGSIRYDLPPESFQRFIDVLKLNDRPLNHYAAEIRRSLATAKEFTHLSQDQVAQALLEQLLATYKVQAVPSTLSPDELEHIERLRETYEREHQLADKPHYEPRGICDLYPGRKCIVPSLKALLPETKPSTAIIP